MREGCRFVSALFGLGAKRSGSEVGGVGFYHQALKGDVRGERTKLLASTLVAEPARDPDRAAEVEVAL
jgi:hypothetical protein